MTTFLKFPDEQTFNDKVVKLGLKPSAEIKGNNFSISVIGQILEGTVIDDEGNEKNVYVDGFYVNLCGELPKGWDSMIINVKTPVRVFG